MTAMDSALNTSAIEISNPIIQANWDELEPGYGTYAGGTESARQLAQQIGPNGYQVTHSFDDGLPDSVTATMGNDASGTFSMDLVGRPPAKADANKLAWNAGATSGSGTGTTITTTLPGDLAFWDYVIVAITVNSDTLITETSMTSDSFWPWNLLGDISDGGAVHTYVFGRKHFLSGVVAPTFKLDASASYAWAIGSIDCGRTPSNDVLVPVTPGDVETAAESVSGTGHNQTPVTVGNRGWTVGVFGAPSAAGTWTSSGNTVVAQVSGAGLSLGMIRSPLRSAPGLYSLSATSGSATSVVAMVHIAFEVRDRAAMDAVEYFSPLNQDSPIYGFERDTATVIAGTQHIATDGSPVQFNQIFYGQMASIGISGRTATMDAVSRTRLLLDDSRTLPTVYGWREGLTTDWITGYLLAQGGQYIGMPPSIYTRWWAPMYGSMHPYAGGSADYTECKEWSTARPGSANRIGAISCDGPFATAMFGQQTDSSVISVNGTADRNWPTEIPGQPGALFKDVFSQQNSIGQITFMIKLDPFAANPSAVTSGNPDDTLLFTMSMWNQYGNVANGGIRININTNSSFNISLGTTSYNLSGGGSLTVDGNWHFVGYYWNYAAGTGRFRWDDLWWDISGAPSASEALFPTDDALFSIGGYNVLTYSSHLPIAELQYEAGAPNDNFARFRPLPTPNAIYRPTRQPLAAIFNTTPVQGWATLQELAQSTLSHIRVNEDDNVEFLPLDYFGEDAQLSVTTLNVLDTDFNAGELDLALDPSQSRNIATIQYTDTRVGSQRVPILEMNTSLAVPRGTTYVTFTLDTPTAETHGAAAWWTSTPEFQKLTSAQVAGTSAIQNENVMSVNTLPDGTGTVFTSTAFRARIYDWDANSITVQFINTYSSTLYLANNGTQIPFLRALGYPITTSDGFSTVRDQGSIDRRRERALTTEAQWIQDRTTAQQVASTLVTLLSEPRPTIEVTVQGDPRRRPGNLVQLVDSTGMKADGTWRINKIIHNGNGPQYTQDLSLVRVGDVAYWDEGTWDETIWGS